MARSPSPLSDLEVQDLRSRFGSLIAASPNFFGSLPESSLPSELLLQGNTSYEELMCLGFNPQFEKLEAVVHLKQNTGYSGSLCTDGSQEYVRFYLSFDDGASWEDQGLASFTAWDFVREEDLEYALSLEVSPDRKLCLTQNLILARAILSWNTPPPPNMPDFNPVWGNVKEVSIQVAPTSFVILTDVLSEAEMELPGQMGNLLELAEPMALKQPDPLPAVELTSLYRDSVVPSHRYLFRPAQALLSKAPFEESLSLPGFEGFLAETGIDVIDLFDQIAQTDGDTSYEEMSCVGFDSNRQHLVATFVVKKSVGYSGGPCSAGSTEYVGFWMDWGDGGGLTYVGTSSVQVHDFSQIPPEGLHYAVFLPVDTGSRQQPCGNGPVLPKVRAILSWETPPPPGDPDWVPTWGNREETLVHVRPGISIPAGTHPPIIQSIGNMRPEDIDNMTGLATGAADGAGFTAHDSPFGGLVLVKGLVAHPPDTFGGSGTSLFYKLWLSGDSGASWQFFNDRFSVTLDRLVGGVWMFPITHEQEPQALTGKGDGWYEYLEDISGPEQRRVRHNMLARWRTGGLTGDWLLRLEVYEPSTGLSWLSPDHRVRIDNTPPSAAIDITSGGGICGDFTVGEIIKGSYTGHDPHFDRLSVGYSPGLGAGTFIKPTPNPRTYPGVPTSGETGTWELDTSGMPKCGYVVSIHVRDRTIVNSGSRGFRTSASVGFCLREQGGP